MELEDATTVLLRKGASYVIERADHGLEPLRFGLLGVGIEPALKAVGMGGKESIGGHLVLTPAVLWFRPHRFNRVRPELGIPLEEITEIADVSRGISRQVEVVMRSGVRLRFVVWGIPRLIRAVESAQRG